MVGPENRFPRPSTGVVETELGEEISLYHATNEEVTMLNVTASDLWRLLDGETSLQEVIRLLAAAYGKGEDEIAAEVTAAVDRLAGAGLIEE